MRTRHRGFFTAKALSQKVMEARVNANFSPQRRGDAEFFSIQEHEKTLRLCGEKIQTAAAVNSGSTPV
ncbi:MAG: hypothetical protein JNJ90_19190 [Saprospiraceae bacterium]|jgi:hypothetical protein|nr:hypothetical protein [Saprospiraceae bacterium]